MTGNRHSGYLHPSLDPGGVGDDPRTMTDLAMSQFSSSIRREKEWWTHLHDPDTRMRWATEGLAHTWTVTAPSHVFEVWLTTSQVDYVLNELSGYSQLRDVQHGCQVSCFERIWESDTLLCETARSNFNSGLSAAFRTIENYENDATRSILDPSMYCLIYDRTLAYDLCDPPSLRPEPKPRGNDQENTRALSKQHAYLPTDFAISLSGAAKARSYINNLHPRQKTLYRSFEEILSQCVPLFERVLTDLHRENQLEPRIKVSASPLILEEPEPPEFRSDDISWAEYEGKKRRWLMSRPMQLPDVPSTGYPGGLENRRHIVKLKNRVLQVIFHVFETALHPGEGSYEGSPWQVHGTENERIVACAYYYASVENLMANALQFRMAVKPPELFPPDHYDVTLQIWGLEHGDPCRQFVGTVPIRQGLCVAFPNVYQHRHTAFSLADPSRAGHQRVVGVFLVDPDIPPIASTSRVPPQQKEWVRQVIAEKRLFAVELLDKILSETDGLIDAGEAELIKRDMLRERSDFRSQAEMRYFGVRCGSPNVRT
ncbi:hypothetical protein F5I97DRAFT_1937142 [Phlebopus sp. FC_14]|nr:hypothetical protein F5I97DRAFT_1937142 [Phlebopus sp. FC_14]